MAQNQSAWWVKYSDYRIEKDENGVEYIMPVETAIPMAYDLTSGIGKHVADLITIAHAEEEQRNMMFAKRFGLLGTALEDKRLPMGEKPLAGAAFVCTGREPEYAGIFASDYKEKTAMISAWLDWIVVVFNRSQSVRYAGRMEEEPFVAITLQTALESACKSLLAEKTIHVCQYCKKVYYDADEKSTVCSDACRRSCESIERLNKLKERFRIM